LKRLAAVLAALVLAGCSVISHERVANWPALTVTEHYVDRDVMVSRCRRYAAAPLACAEFNLDARTCVIWYDKDYAPDWVVEHERKHCVGHDHVGSTAMQEYLNQYLRRSER
jgi:hypothetical protein